jgi:hypothetical protein
MLFNTKHCLTKRVLMVPLKCGAQYKESIVKTWITLSIICAALLVGNYSAFACSFDTDCSPGSKCIKGSGAIYGVCAGGISPGNANDRKPVFDPVDPNPNCWKYVQFRHGLWAR